MSLLSPWALGWLGLLVPLVLLYVLKRRRTRKVVASTILWEQAVRDMRAERPWQRLRPHLSLLLQAAVLILGAIALARPAGAGQIPRGARLAVVIDVSSSMAAVDEGERRLERAVAVARSLARDLPMGGAMMIVAATREPEVLTPHTSDRVELERALDRLAPRGPGVDLEAAVAIAAERLHDAPPGSRVVVLTDAAMTGSVPLAASVPVEVRRVGAPAPNHAIIALDVRASGDADAPDRADVFARVIRHGEGAADVRVTASIEGGPLLGARRLRLEDGVAEAVVLPAELPPDASGRGSFVRVTIEPVDGEDALALDDVAVAASPAARRLPVFLVGDAPAPVQRVLAADPFVELFATDLAALATREGPPLDGLFVYAGETPEVPPPGDSVVVAPRGARAFGGDERYGIALGAPVERPTIVSWEESDVRTRFVRFLDVHLGAVRPIESAAVRALLTTDAGTAIGLVERPDGETTVIAFDPADGDWSAQPGFVVFFRNLLEHARQRRAAGGVAPGELGAPIRVPAPDGETVTLTTPDGHRVSGVSRGGVAVIDVPAVPGVYRAELASGRPIAALRSLTDPEESDLTPRAVFLDRSGATTVATAVPEEHQEAWPWLALALLAFLALDVLWSTRRAAVA